MALFRVVIDKKVLDGFKRRSLRVYPDEHIEAILGTVKFVTGYCNEDHNQILYIHALDKVKKEIANHSMVEYHQPDDSIELGTTLKYLGTIHSHPDPGSPGLDPKKRSMGYSREDKKSFKESAKDSDESGAVADTVMGIAYISKKNNRRFYGFTFYNSDFQKLELVIAEPHNDKN